MQIEDRIKKLLRLSKSPNVHEAQLALDRAFEIAAKYQIDIQTLDLGEELNKIVSDAFHVGLRLSLTKRLALNLIAAFFNVNVVMRATDAVFIGRPADIKVAQYVLGFITQSVDAEVRKWRKFVGHRFTENARRNYIHGWFYAVINGLDNRKQQLVQESHSLAVILSDNADKRDAETKEMFPVTQPVDIMKPKRINRNWLNLGYGDGEKLRLHPAIEAAGKLPSLTA